MVSRPALFFGIIFAVLFAALFYTFALLNGSLYAAIAILFVIAVAAANYFISKRFFKPPAFPKGERLLYADAYTWVLLGFSFSVWPVAVTNKRVIVGGYLPTPSFRVATSYWFSKPPKENIRNLRAWQLKSGRSFLGPYARFDVETWPLRKLHYKLRVYDENAAKALKNM